MGRQAELEVLRAELASAVSGAGRLVLLTGEAGIGKTRTASALADEARAAGAIVAWGRCHEESGAPAYWPWLQALRTCAAESPGAQARALRSILDRLEAPRPGVPQEAPVEHARFELFGRVASALEDASRERPLLLVLDDLQWADVDSLRLLEFVARELGSQPLLILGTARELVLPAAPVARLFAALARPARSLPLAGLGPNAVREIMIDRLAEEPDEMTLERVHRITGGNPFFVIELARLLATNASLAGRALPPATREVLRERLAPLSTEAFRLLEAASVLGQEFDLDLLAVALAQSVDSLHRSLAESLRLGLVAAVPGALRRHAFSHALVREALYSGLAPMTRSDLHLALARALEAAGAASDERLPELAHHAFEAAQTSDPDAAIRHGCEAAERALRGLGFDEAIRWFERVLAALKLRPQRSAASDHALLRARGGLGEALYGAGESARAEAVFREAVDLSRTLGPAAFADTVMRWSQMRSEVGIPNFELNGLLEQALAVLPGDASDRRPGLMARLAAGLHVQPGSEKRRQELAEAALAAARSIDDPAALGFVLTRASIGLLGPDNLERRLSASDAILRIPGAGIGEGVVLDAQLLRIGDLTESGNRVGLDQAFVALDQGSRASGRPFFLWSTVVARSGLALLEGRFDEAEALAEEALALGKKVEPQAAALRFVQQLYPIRAWKNRIGEIVPLIEKSVEQIAIPSWRAALAYAYELCGRRTDARRELDALAIDDFAALPRDATWLSGMALLANLCGRLEDEERARVLYGMLRPYHDRIALNRPLVVAVAPIAMCLGTLAAVCREDAAAEEHFAEALASSERMRALPWQAETRLHWSRLLARRGRPADRERADRLLQEAERTAQATGMLLHLAWIAEHRAAASRPAMESTRRSGRFVREGEVWSLVFEENTTRMRHMIGLSHLAALLARPNVEVHAIDLMRATQPSASESEEIAVVASGDAGEQLDARARAAYETRIRDAMEELEDAERRNDAGQRQRLVEEIDFLTGELARGYGLGGRARRAASAQERARIAVSRAIKYAIDKLEVHDAALADHLRRNVRTGSYCVYVPAARERIEWSL